MLKHALNYFSACIVFTLSNVLGQWSQYSTISERASKLTFEGYTANAIQSYVLSRDLTEHTAHNPYVTLDYVLNAIRLNDYASDKLIAKYFTDNPLSPLSKSAYFSLADYYFNNGKYRYALKWYSKLNEDDIPRVRLSTYYFQRGYTYFNSRRYQEAIPYLEKIKNTPKYESDAYYYLGYIAYQMENYLEADRSFQRVSDDIKRKNLNYFDADMNFRLARFDKAIVAAKLALNQVNDPKQRSELNKIIGESYFNLNQYEEAIPFLEQYEGKNGKLENIDFYQLGYAHYKKADFKTAITYFNKIIGSNDKFAQYAYYYLAECYLNTNNKPAAFNAFRSASQMNFNDEITEDALLNYAKLSYEIGNPYENTPKVLVRFIERYPKSSQTSPVAEILIDSYLKDKNYNAAIEILEGKVAYKDNSMLQKISYLKAIDLYQIGRFNAAIPYFKKSITIGRNSGFKNAALYWLALTYYELEEYNTSLDYILQVNKNSYRTPFQQLNNIYYDIGYVYFKMGDYELAKSAFKKFISREDFPDAIYQSDAYLRIGDCHYALRSYEMAIENYDKSTRINSKDSRYAFFQKAMSYGFINQLSQKIQTLKEFINRFSTSNYLDDALYELASAHSANNQFDEAMATYERLINQFDSSPYRPKAILNSGLLLYNLGKYNEAEQLLKKLVLDYKESTVSGQALNTLREMAVDRGLVKAFATWLRNNGLNEISNINLDEITFLTAERQYMENNITFAIDLFEAYVNDFPEGKYQLSANYYLAELYYQMNNFQASEDYYKQVVSAPVNDFTERSLVRLIEILKSTLSYAPAIQYLIQLESIAQLDGNIRFSKVNLMQLYFTLADYDNAIISAQIVLEMKPLESKVKWDALTIMARSYRLQNNTEKALAIYVQLEKAPNNGVVAEALYYKAKNLKENGANQESIDVIFQIAEQSSTEKWGALALILLSENYWKLGDPFQATYVLESLIENFQQFPDIMEQAVSLLSKIRKETAKENASISNEKNEL